MAVQDRLKLKRPPLDNWTTREQLCLASSVVKSGDQNWISVSRSLKQFIDKDNLKPADWYSPKSCAQQYSQLLETTDTPKRKKRESGETSNESIVRRLTQERIAELNQLLNSQREEYLRHKAEVTALRSGAIKDDKLQKMWQQIEQEEREQEQRNKTHAAWLAKRQQKKDQLQMVSLAVPRNKVGEMTTEATTTESTEASTEDEDKKNKGGGRSPLLTSLLKSPSPTTQMQAPISSAQVTSPTIASLLGSSSKIPTNVPITQTVSPQLHQLVSCGVSNTSNERPSVGAPTLSMLLETPANLQRANLAQVQNQIHNTPTPTLNPPPAYNISNTMEAPLMVTSTPVTQPTTVDTSIPVGQPIDPMQISPLPNIPVTDSMVQIINQFDNIIPKDIMRNVMDKDEMNEFISDIEELIKEEITASPQAMEVANRVIDSLVTPNNEMILQQPLPKVEATAIADSAIPDVSISDIESNATNIADIIGAITDVVEPKIIVTDESVASKEIQPEIQDSASIENSISAIIAQDSNIVIAEPTNQVEEEIAVKVEDIVENIPAESNDTNVSETVTPPVEVEEKKTEEKSIEEPATDVATDVKLEPEGDSNLNEALKQDKVEEVMQVDEVKVEPATTPPSVVEEEQKPIEKEVEKVEEVVQPTKEEEENKVPVKEEAVAAVEEPKEQTIIEKKEVEKKDVEVAEVEQEVKTQTEQKEVQKTETDVVEVKDSVKDEVMEEVVKVKVEPEETTTEEPTEEVAETKATPDKEKEAMVVETTVAEEKPTPAAVVEEKTKAVEEPTKTESKTEDKLVNKEATVVAEKEVKGEVKEVEKEKASEGKKSEVKEEEKVEKDEKPVVKQEEEEKPESEEEEEELKTVPEVVKKEQTESGEEVGEFYDEEPSVSKVNVGRTVKTYSKKQVVVDSETESEGNEGADYRTWKKAVLLVYNRLATHKYASVFLRPITEEQAPGYHSVIFRPMDLSTIKKNIENGTIRTTNHFKRDVMLMFQNAMMYNKQNTIVYQMAVSMQEECLEQMQILVQVTVEPSFRRETRTATSISNDSMDSGIKRKRSLVTPSPNETDSPRNKKYKKIEND